MLKELQSLGLDVRVLRDDNTEVEIMENVDYGNTDFRSIMEGDDRHYNDDEFGAYGYTKQEVSDGEFVNIEDDDDDSILDFDDDFDDLEDDDYTEE